MDELKKLEKIGDEIAREAGFNPDSENFDRGCYQDFFHEADEILTIINGRKYFNLP